MIRLFSVLFALLALAACAGSNTDTQVTAPDETPASDDSAPSPATAPALTPTAAPTVAAEPTPTATPTSTPAPSPTPEPTPSPIPTPTFVVPAPTQRLVATIEDVAVAGAAAINVGVFGIELDPTQETCAGVPSFAALYPPLEAAQSDIAGVSSSNSFFVFRFATAGIAQAAMIENRTSLQKCLDAAGTSYGFEGDWVNYAIDGRFALNGFATSGDLMIRIVARRSERLVDDDLTDLMETLLSAGEAIALAPRQPDQDVASFYQPFESAVREVTVVDTGGAEVATYAQAVVLPSEADNSSLQNSTECESPDNQFGDVWIAGGDEDRALFCGPLLPIQAIDRVSGAPSESHAFFIGNSCPSDFYAVRELEIPLIFTSDPEAERVSLDTATVLSHQCVLR